MTTPSAIITGTGMSVPDRVMTNHDLEKIVDTSDEWIVTRTGIRERRIAGESESLSHFCKAAGRLAGTIATFPMVGARQPYTYKNDAAGSPLAPSVTRRVGVPAPLPKGARTPKTYVRLGGCQTKLLLPTLKARILGRGCQP